MAEHHQRLGRGLSALLGGGVEPGTTATAGEGISIVPVTAITPNPAQPRRHFDENALAALADSIRDRGLLQPVIVRSLGQGRFELIAGERRWQAAQRAGVDEIPAVVRDADARERMELALVENVVREDLNPMEVAHAVAALVEDFAHTHEAVATIIGRSRPAVSNLLRLLELPEVVQLMVAQGALSEGHARAVLMADGAKARRVLAERVVNEGLSVRQTEAIARGARASSGPAAPRDAPPVADHAIDVFYGLFEVPVRVRPTAKGPIVELRFSSDEALHAALERLTQAD